MSNFLRNKNIYTAPAAAVLALGTTACAAEAGPVGELDKSITQVNIDEDARIRSSPGTTIGIDSNVLIETDRSYSVETPDGTFTDTDANGEWYAIPTEELAELVKDPEQAEALREDDDGYGWVSQERSKPERKD